MTFATKEFDGNNVVTYKLTITASSNSDVIPLRGAKSVYLISGTTNAAQIYVPEVTSDGSAPDNTGSNDVRLAALIGTGYTGAVVDPNTSVNSSRAGVIPGNVMPPYIYIKNTDTAELSVDIWVTF